MGKLQKDQWKNIVDLIQALGFDIYIPELSEGLTSPQKNSVLKGLSEFREHLGGKLTIMLLEGIGKGVEVNHIDEQTVIEAISILKNCAEEAKVA
jgi:3-dehydroquinate synthase